VKLTATFHPAPYAHRITRLLSNEDINDERFEIPVLEFLWRGTDAAVVGPAIGGGGSPNVLWLNIDYRPCPLCQPA